MLKKLKKINFYRKPIQWVVVVSLIVMLIRPFFNKEYVADIEAYCPFGGMQSLLSFLINGTLACSMSTMQIGMGLALVLAVIIFSKLFCSFICPLGIFSEWLGKYGQKFKVRYTFKGLADRLLRVFKYALLFLTFYFTITSSELFCKKFDPYFAFFSGFSSEIDPTYAFVAIFILFAGAFFIRQAWCKYFCPLGAVTNIFAYAIILAPLTLIYIALVWFTPLAFSWIVLLFILCVAAFILEAFSMKLMVLPFFNVTRTADTCTSCSKCDKACPMGIKVSETVAVKHIDCHMCGDCVNVCPEKETLNINKKNKLRWLAPTATVLLFVLTLFFASRVELPTITEFWGSEAEIEKAEVYSIDGLKSIKCYGSSMSFALHLRSIKGIVGVKTYVVRHGAKIYFSPDVISRDEVGEAIFTPAQNLVTYPFGFDTNIAQWDVKIDRYFDEFDADYMLSIMEHTKGIYAYKISYGEPAPASFFFNPDSIKPEGIKQAIEQKFIKLFDGETFYDQELEFVVKDFIPTFKTIKGTTFYKTFFPEFDYKFNKFESYTESEIAIISVSIDEKPGPELNDKLMYLMSHVSADKAIVRLTTEYTPLGIELYVCYLKDKSTQDKVMMMVLSPKLKILYEDGVSEEVPNNINFVLR